jgi:hypothetical protein
MHPRLSLEMTMSELFRLVNNVHRAVPPRIPVEALNRVTRIVVHEQTPGVSCPDGLASAIILLDAFWDRLGPKDVEFCSYNSDRINTMPAEPGMLFCDFAPPLERAEEFVRAGTIVLDHHEPERVAPYGALGVYGKKPVSGAYLAYRDVWRPLREDMQSAILKDTPHPLVLSEVIERFAVLAAIRDTWQRDLVDWPYACSQAAALMFWPRDEWLNNAIDWEGHCKKRLPIGSHLMRRRHDDARAALARAYAFTSVRGRRILVVNTLDTSDAGDILDRPVNHDETRPTALIGFEYLMENGVQKIQLSCRSTHDLDVKPFAISLGGGGHDRAAGCRLKAPRDRDPYTLIDCLWNEWESSL